MLSDRFAPAPRGPWSSTPEEDWNDWRWQTRKQLRTAEQLQAVMELDEEEVIACERSLSRFRLGLTPYYASLVDSDDPGCPIRRQAIPRLDELRLNPEDRHDPLGEEEDMPVPGLTWRYPDRVLLYTSHQCAVYCRHCTRRRKVSDPSSSLGREQLENALAFIAENTVIRDVVLSGGDPLSLSNKRLRWLLQSLWAIPHVEIIRLGTRHPVTLPQRIDAELCEIVAEVQPIYVNTHFNHPKECTREAFLATTRLANAGCVLGNQMVLLKGVNDDAEIVKELNRKLLMMRVRPYYIYQCDPAEGISHFRVPLEHGIEILRKLQGWTSGLALPHYVIDLPGGGGKVTLAPDPVVAREGSAWLLRNYRGEVVRVEDAEGLTVASSQPQTVLISKRR